MVLFGCKDIHCANSMTSLSKLRQEGSICDTYLLVGDQRIPAHRCVLVIGSDYFRARFMGPLREENNPDVDLSTVVSNPTIVEKVVDFLYEGVIDINEEALEDILKLASFLLISEIKTYCSQFMEKTLCVGTIVKYYILAVEHVIDIEKQLKETVRTRFHDWLIFDESVLQITPYQLGVLMKSCDIFEYCSYADMLKFVTDWVEAGKTEAHDILGYDLLELMSKLTNRIPAVETSMKELGNVIRDLKLSLKEKQTDSDFMIRLQQLLDNLMIDETNTVNAEKLDAASSASTTFSNERVLLTISPKPCLRQALEERAKSSYVEGDDDSTGRNELPFERSEAIFDICAYIPRKKTWYRLNEGQYSGLYKNIVYEEGSWHFTAHKDTMFCLSPYARCFGKEELDLLNLRDFSFRRIAYHVIRRYLQPNERSFDNMCLVNGENDVYLVSLITDISFDLEPRYFKCFKLTSRNKWTFVFRTPTFNDDSKYSGIVSVAFSPASNEMLLIYGSVTPKSFPSYVENVMEYDESHDMVPCEFFAYVADIGNGEPSRVDVHKLSMGFHTSRSWQILHDENQFYLLEAEHLAGGYRPAYRYKYVYGSKALTAVNSNEEVIGESITMKGDEPESMYVIHRAGSNDGQSAWFFKGNDQNASMLTEVSIDCEGNSVVRAHKPPPFTCITAFMAGNINAECLSGATPVRRYLEA